MSDEDDNEIIIDDPEEEMVSFISQFYKQKNQILPKEILVPKSLPTPLFVASRNRCCALI